jgi:hypothetical protein
MTGLENSIYSLIGAKIFNPADWSVTYFRLSIFNCRNSIRKPDKEAVFHIAACNLSIQSARPDNTDVRKAKPKEQRKSALSEETGKRFSKY